jgi:LmbE family N-acetylglucosaminyl deacetylase
MSQAAAFHQAWRDLPPGSVADIAGSGTCLILAPHPDDESLGCGGLIAACVAAGRPPLVVVLTDGAGSHYSQDYPPDRLRAVRASEVRNAVGHLGLPAERVVFLGEPDTAASREGAAFDAVVARLVALVHQELTCTSILAPWQYDPHGDHEAAALIAAEVAAVTGVRHMAYPVWGWTLPPDAVVPGAPNPGWRLDIQAYLPAKRAAIQAHQSQYGGLITDDPAGFCLPTELLSAFETPYETFIQP